MRALSAVTVITVVALFALALRSGEAPAPTTPAFALTAASDGPLGLRSSRGGQPILSAPALVPGSSVAGKVEITNAGRRVAALTLARRKLTDSPGPNGGRLSESLRIRIARVGRRPVYVGTLAAMPGKLAFPAISPGDSRSFRLRVTLPDTGLPATPSTGDNALQASSTSVGFLWLAERPRPQRRYSM